MMLFIQGDPGMDAASIICPKCNTTFPLTDAIERPIAERLRSQFEREAADRETALRERESALAARMQDLKQSQESLERELQHRLEQERKKIATEQEQKAREAIGLELRDLQQQVAEKSRKLQETQQQQLELMKQRRDLEEARQTFELEKARQIENERAKIREEAQKTAEQQTAAAIRELQEKLSTKEQLLTQAQQTELKLRQERIEFEEQKKAFELEVARRADQVRACVAKEKDEEFRLKEAEAARKMEEMKRQIDDLRRKAEQGSQQTQGEVLELDLESALQRCFGDDEVIAVPAGAHGGDLLQTVRDDLGRACGVIIWESKRTKNWSESWLTKLKDDQLRAKAQLAVLVSTALPRELASFQCRENVWVTPPALAVPLAAALRLVLIETAAAKRAVEGRQDKMSVVYDYLSGPEFRGRITAIVEAFSAMRDDLESEKRAMYKIWAKREKQIERVVVNTVGMHGDLQGIIGHSLPSIELLELDAVPAGANGHGNAASPSFS
jgi:hypothetical protein